MLLSEAFERYIQDRIIFANKSVKTEEAYNCTLKSLLSCNQDTELKDLTFEHLRDWKIALEKRGLSQGTVRGYIVNTRAVLQYMQILGEKCLDARLIPLPNRKDSIPHVINKQEVANLIKAALNTPNCSKQNKARSGAIISLLYASGIRVSELCGLDRRDMQDGHFTLRGKGCKVRTAFYDQRTAEYLNQYLQLRTDANPALFVDGVDAQRLTAGTVQALFRRLSKRAGLKTPIHPHVLRHSFASDLLRNGCHIYPLSRLMGHSNIATTSVYLHLFDGELAEAYARFHSI